MPLMFAQFSFLCFSSFIIIFLTVGRVPFILFVNTNKNNHANEANRERFGDLSFMFQC